jgi:hypothetical protein
MRNLYLPVILLLLCALGSCSHGRIQHDLHDNGQAPREILVYGMQVEDSGTVAHLLPSLPELDLLSARTASCNLEPLRRFGSEYLVCADDALVQPQSSLRLDANAKRYCWAVYRFENLSSDNLGFLGIVLMDGDQQLVFYALPNYELGRWDFFSAQLPDFQGILVVVKHSFTDYHKYYHPVDGSSHVAVFSIEQGSFDLRRVEHFVGIQDTVVVNVTASDDEPNQITVSWDQLDEAEAYRIYYRFKDFPGNLLLLTEVPASELSFAHSNTHPPGSEAISGVVYQYFVIARLPGDFCSRLYNWDYGSMT